MSSLESGARRLSEEARSLTDSQLEYRNKRALRLRKRGGLDRRVQAIRCKACHRLRAHPQNDDPRTHFCPCGCIDFFASFPHPDEEQVALRLYAREIEERDLYSDIAREILNEWKNTDGDEDDKPDRVRLYNS